MSRDDEGEYGVVLEYQAGTLLETVGHRLVRNLLRELRERRPTVSFSRQRYAVHVRVPAAQPTEALRRALAVHDQAIQALGVAPPRLAGVEVLAGGEAEIEREVGWVSAPPSLSRGESVLTNDVYWATRALLGATTASELTDVLIGFVVAVGGQARRHSPTNAPAQVSVEMTLEDGERLFASADEVSVAGLIIGHSLPDLVADARTVLARGRQVDPRITRRSAS